MRPVYNIYYEGKDVVKDFEPILLNIEFKEYLENKAAEIELRFNNKEGHFFNDWYPKVDDKIQASLGFADSVLLDCGLFYVDECTLSGSRAGDSCTIRGMSAKASTIHSDEQRINHENQEISKIVNDIASANGYKPVGDLSGTWTGIQKASGLQFLLQLAKETGRILKIEGTDLIFYKLEDVMKADIVASIDKANVKDYEIKDIAAARISKVTVKSWDANKKEMVEATHETGVEGGGSATVYTNATDSTDAKSKASAAALDKNKKGLEFSITIPGDVRIRAGVKISTTGFGRFDRNYYVAEATHSISRSGYLTKLTLQE